MQSSSNKAHSFLHPSISLPLQPQFCVSNMSVPLVFTLQWQIFHNHLMFIIMDCKIQNIAEIKIEGNLLWAFPLFPSHFSDILGIFCGIMCNNVRNNCRDTEFLKRFLDLGNDLDHSQNLINWYFCYFTPFMKIYSRSVDKFSCKVA